MLNILPSKAENGYLAATLEWRRTAGAHDAAPVPFQNGIPLPSFDPQKRPALDLCGEWRKERFRADHNLTMAPRSREWVSRVEREAAGRTGIAFDDCAWETICLPLPENGMTGAEKAAAAEKYEDGVWYRRTFQLDVSWDWLAVTLKCLSVSYVCDIWVNGEWAGCHEGGYTPFALDVTPFVGRGTNTIAIRVDNPPWGSRMDTIPAQADTDFFNYTGVIQGISLEGASRVHIARLDVVPLGVDGRLRIRAVIENRSDRQAAVQAEGELFEAVRDRAVLLRSPYAADLKASSAAEVEGFDAAAVRIGPWQAEVLEWEVRVKQPQLWALGEPNLYVAELRLSEDGNQTDTFDTQFGIRTVKAQGSRLLLNGGSVFLRGIARHEEWPGYGRTASWERIAADLVQLEGLHVNLVRTGHYPNHPYTYLLTDRLGLAAMCEIPLWQFDTVHYEVQAKKGLADQMWREMIFAQYNRPSVLLWSTQNESREVLLRKAYNERLVKDLRTNYDDGRLTTQSAAADRPGADDPSMEPLDVAAWTMYFGVFHGGTAYEGTAGFLEEAHKCWPDKPILNTEFGHWSGEDGEDTGRQIAVYKDTMRALMEKAAVTPSGEDRPEGILAGIDYWAMYNWHVNHCQWVQTMGVYHMDRLAAKPVKALIEADYRKLAGGS